MEELNSLILQLENLKVLYDDAILKGYSKETIKMYQSQIKETEEVIQARKKKLEN